MSAPNGPERGDEEVVWCQAEYQGGICRRRVRRPHGASSLCPNGHPIPATNQRLFSTDEIENDAVVTGYRLIESRLPQMLKQEPKTR